MTTGIARGISFVQTLPAMFGCVAHARIFVIFSGTKCRRNRGSVKRDIVARSRRDIQAGELLSIEDFVFLRYI